MGKPEKAPAAKAVTTLLLGGGIALAVTLAALLGCAAAISAGGLQLEDARSLTMVCCALGGFLGGVVAVRRLGRRALPAGLATGLLLFLLLMATGLLCTETAAPGLRQLPLLLSCLCAGGLAGLMGRKRKKRRT